jgi:hypothetical protein
LPFLLPITSTIMSMVRHMVLARHTTASLALQWRLAKTLGRSFGAMQEKVRARELDVLRTPTLVCVDAKTPMGLSFLVHSTVFKWGWISNGCKTFWLN